MDYTPANKIKIFRPAWVPQTKEPETPAVRTCPFKHPLYNGEQPECFHDCALYDGQNNRCGLLSDPTKTEMVNAARREVGRR
mgnify:FL=1